MPFMSKFGDWEKVGRVLRTLSIRLYPAFRAQLREDGEFFLKSVLDHIDAQDLSWTPLADKTIELKNGDDTFYVETGFLKDNLEVRKVKADSKSITLFIGASPWKRTSSGEKLSDVMMWLEYGTDRVPPRPLIRPTWTEVEPVIKDNWRELLKDLIEGKG